MRDRLSLVEIYTPSLSGGSEIRDTGHQRRTDCEVIDVVQNIRIVRVQIPVQGFYEYTSLERFCGLIV